jgi:hypothetical protein
LSIARLPAPTAPALLAAAGIAAAILVHGAGGRTSRAAVVALPSSATIPASGALPPGGSGAIALNVAVGEQEGAWIVVSGAKQVAAAVEPGSVGGIGVTVRWGHYVSVGGRPVPDALLPWDGSAQASERPNQPIYVSVDVPQGTAPALLRSTLQITADGVATPVPLRVEVYPVRIPAPGRTAGMIPTSFRVGGESYVDKVNSVFHLSSNDERQKVNASLYGFLAQYRIAPDSFGYGDPKDPSGYGSSTKWWLDAAGNMKQELEAGPGFVSMHVPISSNRASARNWIGKIDPGAPQTWCGYLKSVRKFWQANGWLSGNVLPFLYGQDEPGATGQKLVARQSAALHTCFPGARSLMTGNPSPTGANSFLYDGKNGDDLDIFAVLGSRFYGSFTTPSAQKEGRPRERQLYDAIQKARKAGKQIWSYTYPGSGTPSFSATEPLSDPRVFLLWNALEGTNGLLYGQGVTTYGPGNPLTSIAGDGDLVLVYPGRDRPVASARLEQIRDGLEDWMILDIVRRKHGAGAVRRVLGGTGLFSADAKAVKLGCNLGCDVETDSKYSWPLFSHDGTTPGRIEAAKKQMLELAR